MTALEDLEKQVIKHELGEITTKEFADYFIKNYDSIYKEAGLKDKIKLRMAKAVWSRAGKSITQK